MSLPLSTDACRLLSGGTYIQGQRCPHNGICDLIAAHDTQSLQERLLANQPPHQAIATANNSSKNKKSRKGRQAGFGVKLLSQGDYKHTMEDLFGECDATLEDKPKL